MSDKKRLLIVSQEIDPYTALTNISNIARKLPQYAQEKGNMEIRVLMPRYGTINERRHRLHEVVRLSGMNIIVDDDDYPLIIKVASVKGARMQVYFLDNEDFFKRKSIFTDKNEKPFEDNPERMVFFCKGVLETVKKFGWSPDIIHCHGWMTSLIPLYLRTAYKNEPLFLNSKIVYSLYDNSLEHHFNDSFLSKATINNLQSEDLTSYIIDSKIKLQHGATSFSDAVIRGEQEMSAEMEDLLQNLSVPVLDYQDETTYLSSYLDFYNSLMIEEEVKG